MENNKIEVIPAGSGPEETTVRLTKPIKINETETINEITLREPFPRDLMENNISRGDLFMMSDKVFIKLLPIISTPMITRQHYNQLNARDSQSLITETLMFFQ